MATWVNNMGLKKGSHLVAGSTLMPKWEDRSGMSIVQNNVNLLPKNRPQDPMNTKGPVFEVCGAGAVTYNLPPALYKLLAHHNYFKSLYVFDTFEKVVDLIYHKVSYVEPWASRGDSTPSSAWIFLLKLFTLRLSEAQVTALLNHADSPYLRAMGALYVRYGADQAQLWRWLGDYADDLEEFAPSTDPNALMTFGSYCVKLLTDANYHGTTFPALNVPIQRAIKVCLVLHDEMIQRGNRNARLIATLAPGASVRAIYDDFEAEPRWFQATVDEVIPPYEGAPEGTWPTYMVTFAHGPKGKVKLGQLDLGSCGLNGGGGGGSSSSPRARGASPSRQSRSHGKNKNKNNNNNNKTTTKRRRRRSPSSSSSSSSDDDSRDRRRHKKSSRRRDRSSRDRHRSSRDDDGGGPADDDDHRHRGRDEEPGEVLDEAPSRWPAARPMASTSEGESILAGRDILGAVIAQERAEAVADGVHSVIRHKPSSFDAALITPASTKCATYRRRSRSKDRIATIVGPVLVHLDKTTTKHNADDDSSGSRRNDDYDNTSSRRKRR